MYNSITPSTSFDGFDFNEEQIRLQTRTRNLTAVNDELQALESLFPPDIAGSQDTAYENYVRLHSELEDELAFQKDYATVLDVFERERDSHGSPGAFLASAGTFAEFLRQSERFPPAIREKARMDFTRRLAETQPHYESQLRAKKDATPIALDPPVEPVLALYGACGVQPPSEMRTLLQYVESYNTEARALAKLPVETPSAGDDHEVHHALGLGFSLCRSHRHCNGGPQDSAREQNRSFPDLRGLPGFTSTP